MVFIRMKRFTETFQRSKNRRNKETMPTALEQNTILRVVNLTKEFPGVIALKDVSFDLREGEVHALCGENGAGKSTLIKVLSGIHPAGTYQGTVELYGHPVQF